VRLTVGPLPSAVYWRRRAVVLVSLAMVVLVISYSCTGPDAPASTSVSPSQSASASTAPATTTHPNPTPTATPTPPAFTLPGTAATGPCTDAEIDLSATPASESVPRGQTIDLTIKIKNTSGRTCSRDLGADPQELRILLDGTLVWSSDDCSARKGSDVRSLTPGKEISFTLSWAGTRSRTATGAVDCNAASPNAATYQLVARLDQKLSQPVALRVR
jgi:hypothetical protein